MNIFQRPIILLIDFIQWIQQSTIIWLTFFVLAVVLLVFGCGKKSESTNEGKLTILAHSAGAHLNQVREDIVKDFNQKHPDTPATIEFVGNEYYTVLQTRLTGGAAPDILLWMDASKIGVFQEKGQLLDLTPFADADTTFNIKEYYEPLINRVKFNGKLYGLAADASMMVLFYNKDMFDQAGVAYPDETWTWSTFKQVCKKLTKVDKSAQPVQFGTIPFVWIYVWIPTVWQNGGDLFSPDLSHCTLNEPAAYEAIQYIADMMSKDKVATRPTATSLNYDQEFNNLFLAGRVAMMPTGSWMVNMLEKSGKFKWGVAPLPKEKTRATFLDATYCAVLKNTKNPKASWEFLKHYCGSPGALRRVREHEIVPAQKSVIASPEFLNFAGSEANRKVFTDVLFTYGRIVPSVTNWDEIQDVMVRYLDKVWTGEGTAKEVCSQLAPEVDRLLKKNN
jgi:multiple sugar transport system substrate-binding protein